MTAGVTEREREGEGQRGRGRDREGGGGTEREGEGQRGRGGTEREGEGQGETYRHIWTLCGLTHNLHYEVTLGLRGRVRGGVTGY